MSSTRECVFMFVAYSAIEMRLLLCAVVFAAFATGERDV